MTLRLWTYRCDACGHLYDSEPIMTQRLPKTIKCRQRGCKGRASWARPTTRVNGIHNSISTLYGRAPDPQYGDIVVDPETGQRRRKDVTVESYDHKRRLLKEKGMIEGDVERYEDIMADHGPDTGTRDPRIGAVQADDDEGAVRELIDMAQSDPRVSRKHTGPARTQLLDSGIKW